MAQKTGRCPQGAAGTTCNIWTGKVTFIGDGDTISVDLDGDKTKKPVRVRITGIQAMEETYYTNNPKDRTGDCHANEATDRVEQLVKAGKKRVELAAMNPESRSGSRLRRWVGVRMHSKWRDVGRTLIREGHALWLGNGQEWAWNRAYSTIAEQAATQGQNLWNPEYCLPGPVANIRMWANGDADGSDTANPNGEWVRIRNADPVAPLDLTDWWVRDSALRRYVFPPGTVVAPGTEITVYPGRGTDTPTDLFWGLRGPIFDNVNKEKATGDGAYLFDLDGDLRAAMQYPCRYRCADPAKDAFEINPRYKRHNEYVTIKNVSPAAIDLEGYRLADSPHFYPFGADSVLQPGEAMRVDVLGDPATDTRLHRHWGLSAPILANGGDRVEVTNLRYTRVGCYSWGSESC